MALTSPATSHARCGRAAGSLATMRPISWSSGTGTAGIRDRAEATVRFRLWSKMTALVVPKKCRHARDHFVQRQAEREEVAPGVDVPAARLFGGHVCESLPSRWGVGANTAIFSVVKAVLQQRSDS